MSEEITNIDENTTLMVSSQTELDKMLEVQDEVEQTDHSDFSQLNKEELLQKAEDLINTVDVKKAGMLMEKLRQALDNVLKAELPLRIKEWTEAGNDPREFKAPRDEAKDKFALIMERFREMREEERKRAEQEKMANLKKKQAVLEKLKQLVDGDETANSRDTMRDILREWKEIRQIPKEFHQQLNETYKFYLDKYYDNVSMFQELKELDREKNLEEKIELIKKVESLKGETNIRRALVTLNKYHEDWKIIGPVRKEISDEIWQRFKQASDLVMEEKRGMQEERSKMFNENYEIKRMMAEKAEQLVQVLPVNNKEWQELGKQLDTLLDQWKLIGHAGPEKSEEVWAHFLASRTVFFTQRKAFYANINSQRNENLKLKEKLVAKAAEVATWNDFNKGTDALNKLQEEWKTIGPVPDSKSQEIWKTFRASFDTFFEKKNAWFNQRKQEEKVSMGVKKAILDEMEALKDNENGQEVFAKLKDCQMRWNNAGFVNNKQFAPIQKKYQELGDSLFNKFKKSAAEMKETVMQEHYNTMAGLADGKNKLFGEERKIRDRIEKLNSEINTLERNLSFFSNSKNADAIKKEYEGNIAKAKENVLRLQKELKVIRDLKNADKKAENAK